jgi:excisionase family DNA binding protein
LEEQKILLTVKEFSKVSGLGENCIRNLVRVEGFPALKNGRKFMIHRRAADKWLEDMAKHAHSGCAAM